MAVKSSFVFLFSSTLNITPFSPRCSKLKPPRGKITAFSCSDLRYDDDDDYDKQKAPMKKSHGESFCCICGRRRFIEAATATSTALAMFPICPSNASDLHSDDYMVHFYLLLSKAFFFFFFFKLRFYFMLIDRI